MEHDECMDDDARSREALVEQGKAVGRGPRMRERASQVRQKTDWTVEELYEAELTEGRWIVPELLPVGLASLAGRPKLGKSWLALQLAGAVAGGGSFLGRKVRQGRVLVIALEDSPQRLGERVRCLGLARSAPIEFHTSWPALNEADGMEELERTVAEWQPRLVVIDTLARAFDGRIEWNAVGDTTGALAPLQRLAHEQQCCVLMVDHHKKPGAVRNVIDDILGSTGKAAVIDTAWGLYRGHRKGRATLRATGRDLDATELALEFSEAKRGWEVRVVSQGPGRDSLEEKVAQALRELGGVGTTSEIARRLGMGVGSVSHALAGLVADGEVRRRAREGHRVPYEWVR